LQARWGRATVVEKVSPYSYKLLTDEGTVRTLHANLLRRFVNQLSTVGVIFEEESEFGQVDHYPIADDIPPDPKVDNSSDKYD